MIIQEPKFFIKSELLVASRVFNAVIGIILKLPTGDKQKAHLLR